MSEPIELKRSGSLKLTPGAPSYGGTGWIAGDPPPFPPVNPPTSSLFVNGVPVIPTINGVPQTQQPAPPLNYTWR